MADRRYSRCGQGRCLGSGGRWCGLTWGWPSRVGKCGGKLKPRWQPDSTLTLDNNRKVPLTLPYTTACSPYIITLPGAETMKEGVSGLES